MKCNVLMAIGVSSSLSLATFAAASSEEAEFGSAERSASRVADTTQEEHASDASVSRSRTNGTLAGKPKPAGTGTAAGYILDQAKKGNIKIEGAIDGDDWDKPD